MPRASPRRVGGLACAASTPAPVEISPLPNPMPPISAMNASGVAARGSTSSVATRTSAPGSITGRKP